MTKKSTPTTKKPARSTKKSTTPKRSSGRTTSKQSATGKTRGGTGTRRKSSTSSGSSSKSSGSSQRATSKRSATRRSTKKTKPAFSLSNHQKAILSGLLLVFVAAIVVLSLVSPGQGELTRMFSNWTRNAFGWGAAVVPLILGGFGGYLIMWGMEQPPRLNTYRLVGTGLFFLAFEALATLFVAAQNNGVADVWFIARQQRGGGYLGGGLAWIIERAIGAFGASMLYLILAVVSLVMIWGVSRVELGERFRKLMERPERMPVREDEDAYEDMPGIPINPAPLRRAKPVRVIDDPEEDIVIQAVSEEERAEDVRRRHQMLRDGRQQDAPQGKPSRERKTPARDKPTPKEAVVQPTAPAMIHTTRGAGHWELPVVASMLELGISPESAEEKVQEQWITIEQTLESFGAPGRIVDVNPGPTVTQFGVEPLYVETRSGKRTKVKVSKIAGLADDLSLALAAKSVRIEAPVPGKGYIGIEVPNAAKVIVSLRDTIEATEFQRIKSPLRIGLGQDVAGNSIAADLAKMPHLLVAGATGSGKSVCVNSIIASLLLHNTPDELRFVMVDPKRVELTGYNGIPHLAAPVVVEMDRVVGVLQWALREMDSRYTAFAGAGARNIISYNQKMEAKGADKLPYMVIIIDELADLMMTAPEDTERALARLAQMARATGIHMIVATQRPSVDVVTGLIKANFPARIAFAVSSSTDSRVILDTVGAERLLGMGDMLFQKPDAPTPMRMQGCYVSDEELNALINYWKTARRFQKYSAAETVQKRGGSQPVAPKPVPVVDAKVVVDRHRPKPQERPARPARPQSENGGGRGHDRLLSPQPAPTAEPIFEQPEPIFEQNEPLRAPPAETQAPPPVEDTSFQQPLWDHLIEEEKKKQEQVDELWDEAIAFVKDSGKASTSMLQRRFRIGYTRAARIIDAMEEANIIGPPTGTSKAREVLLPKGEEFKPET